MTNAAYQREYRKKHRDKLNARQVQYNKKGRLAMPKEKRRALFLKRTYGLLADDYDALYRSQKGACAICGNQSDETLCVDHDHSNGHVRGLLCRKCNAGLGQFGENVFTLRRAIGYLERFYA